MIPLSNNYVFEGVVEDVMDPALMGRVRVRIAGIHTDNKSLIPTDMLPWSNVGMPVTSASISGVGQTPVGLVNGSRVGGLFLDGADMQQPIVLWSLAGHANINKNGSFGFNDPDGVYPKASTTQDLNILATGVMTDAGGKQTPVVSDMQKMKEENREPEQGVDPDPTVKPPVEDPEAFKDAPWMKYAAAEIGTDEENNAAKIREFHKVGGGSAQSEDVAWCAAFVGWCLKQVDIQGTRSAMARSYVNYGKKLPTDKIPYGSIVIFQGTRGPSSGHVCFVTKDLGDKLEVIGGNQTTDNSSGKNVKYDTGGKVTKVNFPKSKLVAAVYPTNLQAKT